MALQKITILGNGLIIENTYNRIDTVSGSKGGITVSVNSYVSQTAFVDGKEYLQQQFFTFVPSVADNEPNFIHQGYEYLKTLPEFADATDA